MEGRGQPRVDDFFSEARDEFGLLNARIHLIGAAFRVEAGDHAKLILTHAVINPVGKMPEQCSPNLMSDGRAEVRVALDSTSASSLMIMRRIIRGPGVPASSVPSLPATIRSEERRVEKECRSR